MIKPLEQLFILFAYKKDHWKKLQQAVAREATNRSVVIGPPTQNKKSRLGTDSSVIPVIDCQAGSRQEEEPQEQEQRQGGPEDFHLLEELVRTHSVAVVHFSSTSVG